MPHLIRLYIRHVLIGFGLSAVLVALLLWSGVGNLWHLISTSDMGAVALLMLWVFNGIVLAGVQFGIAIMGMADPASDSRGPGPRGPALPVAVPATGPATVPATRPLRRP